MELVGYARVRASPPHAHGRKGDRPRRMTPERLRYAQHLMADRERSIPAICRDLGGVPASTLYHYLHADGGPSVATRRAASARNGSAKLPPAA